MPDVLNCLCVLVLCTAVITMVGVVSCAVACFLQWLADKVMDRWWKV